MNIKKSLITALILTSCAGILTNPAALAKGNGASSRGGSAVTQQRLSKAEIATLFYMREEEKLARDVYLTLHETWGMRIFSNIAASEQTHADKVKSLLEKYGLQDPVKIEDIGVFTDMHLQELYHALVEQGSGSLVAALKVGAFIEETDIVDLQHAIDGTNRADIINVYSNLLKGSRNHLQAYARQLAARGESYEATALTQEEFDAIAFGR